MRNLYLTYKDGEATHDLSNKTGINTNAVGVATFPYKACSPATVTIDNVTLKVIHSDKGINGQIYTSVILFIW